MKARNSNLTLCNDLVRILARKTFPVVILLGLTFVLPQYSQAQCGAGFTASTINWDNMDYYYNSGNNTAPYGFSSPAGNYITNTMMNTQKFAIGRNYLTIALSASMNPLGENGTNTGDVTVAAIPYTGDDVQYQPTANAQTITITFNTAVSNASFTLYDIDEGAVLTVGAQNTTPAALVVGTTLQGTTILTSVGATTKTITSTAATVANNQNTGTVTCSIAGPNIKTITITVVNRGGDEDFWLSDIVACVPNTVTTGIFPTNYHQTTGSKPFTGAGGVNQPDYFLATPDNDAVYMVDPATGNARFLFIDPARDYVNSFAYDAVGHILYYISENPSADPTNKALKKYDFNTNTISTVFADITAALGIPIFSLGIESAGAAWYDGSLYLGVEGGKFGSGGGTVTRESIIWRLDFTGATPTNAYQVCAFPSVTNGAGSISIQDWGDFVIKDGELVNFNTARNGTNYAQSKFHHFNMTTGAMLVYTNPGPPANQYSGQGGLTWTGDMYWCRDSVGKYNGNGTVDPTTKKRIVVVPGSGPYPAWVGGTGDASDPFRPKCDFGDAPVSYDGAGDPAVHEYDTNLVLGSAFDLEWVKTGSTALANSDGADEDALAFTPLFTHTQNGYDVDIRVTNKTGAAAKVVAWIDINNNGTFEASEGIVVNVNSLATIQNVHLAWTGKPTIPVGVTNVFMRIRLASSALMTTSTPNGWFANGEVEDFRVVVDDVLPVKLISFTAAAVSNQYININWKTTNEQDLKDFVLERSKDGVNWETVTTITAKGNVAGDATYNYHDQYPYQGTSYYRLQMRDQDGRTVHSDSKKVSISKVVIIDQVAPNPFTNIISVNITLLKKESVQLKLIDQSGNVVRQKKINAQEGASALKLDDVGRLPSGFYILEIITSAEVKREKILKK